MDETIFFGTGSGHLLPFRDTGKLVHPAVRHDLQNLCDAAREVGFEVQVFSAFRGFPEQLKIWNEKALGTRSFVDDFEQTVDPKQISPEELLFKILRWSALPGMSRHHWGTDIDLVDAKALQGKKATLSPMEARTTLGPFNAWLKEHCGDFNFFHPYASDRGGIAVEPWHVSHISTSAEIFANYRTDGLERLIRSTKIELQAEVLMKINLIYERFFLNICPPAPIH